MYKLREEERLREEEKLREEERQRREEKRALARIAKRERMKNKRLLAAAAAAATEDQVELTDNHTPAEDAQLRLF